MSPKDPRNPAPTGASLNCIAEHLGVSVVGNGNPKITGIHHDSRRVEPGDLFVARRGERSDGLRFIKQAVQQGAVAVLAEVDHAPDSAPIPVLLVPDIRAAIGRAANVVYADPTAQLDVVGLTGTNGKTTTSYMLRSAIDGAGGRTGVLGTLGASFGDLHFGAVHTTPEADEVARVASAMSRNGATHMVMEVSSHALDQHRADAVRYRVAAFTNLTQDHLDYHSTFEAYAAAKARLFFELGPRDAVFMVDDQHGLALARRYDEEVGKSLRVSTSPESKADIHPVGEVHFHARGLACSVRTPSGQVTLEAPYVGHHNLANLLLALGIVSALGLDAERAAEALRSGAPRARSYGAL